MSPSGTKIAKENRSYKWGLCKYWPAQGTWSLSPGAFLRNLEVNLGQLEPGQSV